MQNRKRNGQAARGNHHQRLGALALCGILLCGALAAVFQLRACAAQAAPAGCTLKKGRPAQSAAHPLGEAEWHVSSGYGWREDPLTAGETEFHRGADLACAEGTPVLAAMDGVAAAARRSASYGNYVVVRHADGWETLYAHLQYIYVRAGEIVRAGQPIGAAGQTGRATGSHLHFELKGQGVVYDPSAVLGL